MPRPSDDRARRRSSTHHPSSSNRRSGNPAKRAAATDARRPQGRPHSYPALLWLHRQPRWLVPVATVLLTLGGMFLTPVLGGICLLLVAGFLGWLASLAWPRLTAGARVARVVIIVAVAAVAFARMSGLWVS